MSTTFEQLIVRTGYWLNQAGVLGGLAGRMDSHTSATAEGKYFVNVAYRDIIHRLQDMTGKPFAVAESLLSLVASQETYDLPSDFGRLQSIEGGWESGTVPGDRYPIPQCAYENRTLYYSSNEAILRNGESIPRMHYYIYSPSQSAIEKIGFTPIPTESKTSNVKILYWPFKTELSGSDDVIVKQLDEWSDLISIRAAILIAMKAGRAEQLQMLQVEYQSVFDDWKNAILKLTKNEPEVPAYYGTYEPF